MRTPSSSPTPLGGGTVARRGHGEDSIYFDRANRCWVGAVSLGHKTGKRVRRKVSGRTKTEVKAKLRQLRRELNSSDPGLRRPVARQGTDGSGRGSGG